MASKKLFIFSTFTNYTEEAPRARHQLADRFLEHGEVVFIQREGSPLELHGSSSKDGFYLERFPSFCLPRKLILLIPLLRFVYFSHLQKKINEVLKKYGKAYEAKDIFILNFRYDCPYQKDQNSAGSFYICNDEFVERQPLLVKNLLRPIEFLTARRATHTFSIHYPLRDKFLSKNIETTLFFPGVDIEGFRRRADGTTASNKRSRPPLRIGYGGFISLKLDFEVFEAIQADVRYSLSLMGPVEPEAEDKVRYLKDKGVEIIPAKRGDEYLRELEKFDALVIPYRLINATKAITFPNKIFPYLQTGRPVLMTKLPFMFDIPDEVVTKIDDCELWINSIEETIKANDEGKAQKRVEFAKQFTWSKTSRFLLEKMQDLIR